MVPGGIITTRVEHIDVVGSELDIEKPGIIDLNDLVRVEKRDGDAIVEVRTVSVDTFLMSDDFSVLGSAGKRKELLGGICEQSRFQSSCSWESGMSFDRALERTVRRHDLRGEALMRFSGHRSPLALELASAISERLREVPRTIYTQADYVVHRPDSDEIDYTESEAALRETIKGFLDRNPNWTVDDIIEFQYLNAYTTLGCALNTFYHPTGELKPDQSRYLRVEDAVQEAPYILLPSPEIAALKVARPEGGAELTDASRRP